MQKIRIYSAMAFVLFFAVAQAQSVDKIIEKHIAALGGKEKMKAIKSVKYSGKMAITAMGFEADITRQSKRPYFLRMDITMQGQNIVQAYDGKTAWQINPMTGNMEPQEMPETQAKSMVQQSDMDGEFVDYKKKGHQFELIGKEDLEGTEVYKIKCTPNTGDMFFSFIDSEHYLELKRVTRTKGPGGNEIESEVLMSDYKPVAGLMTPHSITLKNPMQGEIEISFTNIEVNIDIDDSLFSMPEKK
ncbi:MAG: outer membrane lipoprotein-sorting protein [bacterium]